MMSEKITDDFKCIECGNTAPSAECPYCNERYNLPKQQRMSKEVLTDEAFISLINVLMEADPWGYSVDREPLVDLADDEARERGYCDWIEALHKFIPLPDPQRAQENE